MTTLQQIELVCPVCETRFRSQAVVSTNSFGGKRTDFHERAAGTQPLPYLVHMCARCGYAGAERDFTEEADVTPTLKEHVWAELAPALPTLLGRGAPNGSGAQGAEELHDAETSGVVALSAAGVAGSEKYEAAAKVAEWGGADARHVADLLLRAAWCCVDEGDVEAERFFRRKAAWAFERALSGYDGVAREERAVLTYLVGELWRRSGDLGQARAWFDRVPAELTDPAAQQWISKAALQQRDHPREWFE
jgi:uncharacterized protein (DUF2225 family)